MSDEQQESSSYYGSPHVNEGVMMRRPEAARYIGVAEATLAGYATRGIGPKYHKLSRRCVVYKREDLDAWLQTKLVTPGARQ